MGYAEDSALYLKKFFVVGISRLGSRWALSPTPIDRLVVLDHEVGVVRVWKINSTGHSLSPFPGGELPSLVVFSVCSAACAGGFAVGFAD